jgi:hypothetical protein
MCVEESDMECNLFKIYHQYTIHNHRDALHYLTSFCCVSLSHCKLSSLSYQRLMHEDAAFLNGFCKDRSVDDAENA